MACSLLDVGLSAVPPVAASRGGGGVKGVAIDRRTSVGIMCPSFPRNSLSGNLYTGCSAGGRARPARSRSARGRQWRRDAGDVTATRASRRGDAGDRSAATSSHVQRRDGNGNVDLQPEDKYYMTGMDGVCVWDGVRPVPRGAAVTRHFTLRGMRACKKCRNMKPIPRETTA